MPMHFLKAAERDLILKGLSGKAGAYDIITNFNVTVKYPTLEVDPKFLDPKKFEGVMNRLMQWVGPLGLLFKREQGRALDDIIPVLDAELDFHRGFVKDMLEEVFNDPAFKGEADDGGEIPERRANREIGGPGEPPPGTEEGVPLNAKITVSFSGLTLVTFKNLLNYITVGVTNGVMSPQTARTGLRLNEEQENANMVKAHATPANYTPVFEAKQGLLQDPGDQEPDGSGGGGGGAPAQS